MNSDFSIAALPRKHNLLCSIFCLLLGASAPLQAQPSFSFSWQDSIHWTLTASYSTATALSSINLNYSYSDPRLDCFQIDTTIVDPFWFGVGGLCQASVSSDSLLDRIQIQLDRPAGSGLSGNGPVCILKGTIITVDEVIPRLANPAIEFWSYVDRGNLWVHIGAAQPQAIKIQLLDSWGRVIRMQWLEAGQTKLRLPVSGVASGRYFLQIWQNGKPQNQSILLP